MDATILHVTQLLMRRCETSGGARCAGLKAASSYQEGRVSVVVNMSIWICPKNRRLQAFLINVIFFVKIVVFPLNKCIVANWICDKGWMEETD